MIVVALSLVLSAAFIHASWNFLAKRVSGGGSDICDCPRGVILLRCHRGSSNWANLAICVGETIGGCLFPAANLF